MRVVAPAACTRSTSPATALATSEPVVRVTTTRPTPVTSAAVPETVSQPLLASEAPDCSGVDAVPDPKVESCRVGGTVSRPVLNHSVSPGSADTSPTSNCPRPFNFSSG